MQRGGALADSQRVLQDATDSGGTPLPGGRKDAGERIEVGDDRGGAYKVPSADAPIQSRQTEIKKAVRIQNERGTLIILVFRSQKEVLSIFQVRLRVLVASRVDFHGRSYETSPASGSPRYRARLTEPLMRISIRLTV